MIKYSLLLICLAFSMMQCSKNTSPSNVPNMEMEQDSMDMEEEILPKAYVTEIAQFPDVINECSGLIKINDRIISMNDGSTHTLLQEINPETAEVVSTINVSAINNIDWEALQYANGKIYIADTGNNEGDRETLSLYTVPYEEGTEFTCTDTINFIWPDQTTFESATFHPFDCESLLIKDNEAIFFSKNRSDLKSNVYRLNLQTNEIIKGESISIGGLSTDAAFDPSGDVILLSYITLNGSTFSNKINILQSVNSAYEVKHSIPITQTTQIEAIVHLGDHKYLLGAESESSSGGFLYSLDLNDLHQLRYQIRMTSYRRQS